MVSGLLMLIHHYCFFGDTESSTPMVLGKLKNLPLLLSFKLDAAVQKFKLQTRVDLACVLPATSLSVFEQFAPEVYDNSDLPLTDLEKEILELRSKDRGEEKVGEAAKLVEHSDVSVGAVLRTFPSKAYDVTTLRQCSTLALTGLV